MVEVQKLFRKAIKKKSMKGNGKRATILVKEPSFMPRAIAMKVSGRMVKRMVRACIFMRMAIAMKVSGKIIIISRVCIFTKMAIAMRETGAMTEQSAMAKGL